MIQKVITKRTMNDVSPGDDLAYWKNRSREERISAVETLRRQHHGSSERLQRSVRVIERSSKEAGAFGDVHVHYIGKTQYIANKRAAGRKKDLADIEALGEN